MKRDMDFVREMLSRIESDQTMDGFHFVTFEASDFPGRSLEEIAYHLELLSEAGLVKLAFATNDSPVPAISRLTWQGHEFIADTSDPGVWARVKERTKDLPNVALSAVWELAKAELRKKLGLP